MHRSLAGCALRRCRVANAAASLCLAVACVPALTPRMAAADEPAPNILFILADDLGYMDVNSFAERLTGTPAAQQFYETPNLDRLADSGVSFTQAYTTPLCAPTRSALMTGQYGPTLGFTTATPGGIRAYYHADITPPAGFQLHDQLPQNSANSTQPLLRGTTLMALPTGSAPGEPNVTTFAEAMPDHHRAFTGKWHLGSHGATGYQPQDNGYDEALSHIDAGSAPYFGWENNFRNSTNQHTGENKGSVSSFDSGEDYLTDDQAARAADFIQRRHQSAPDAPWMMEVSLLAVHTPIQAKQEDIDYFEGKATQGWNGHTNATYAGMIKSMDDAVGTLLDTLEATGELQNTAIVFMSDNGGIAPLEPDDDTITNNAPLRGAKAQIYEGGVRVPLIVSAPFLNHATGVASDAIVDATDIAPTLLDLGGYDSQAFVNQVDGDGSSLRPLLDDPTNAAGAFERDTIYFHYPYYVGITTPSQSPSAGIRRGDWKLVLDETGYVELFNIADDISETTDLSATHPEIAARLYWMLRNWQDAEVDDRYRPSPNPNYTGGTTWPEPRDLNLVYAAYEENSITGDANLDGDVDDRDYDRWNADFGGQGALEGDLNNDASVTASDYAVWRSNAGRSIYDVASKPEPAFVFSDTFDAPADSADINLDLALRQSGGAVDTAYTTEGGAIDLLASRNLTGDDGVLRLTTAGSATPGPTSSELNLETDFSPHVAGKTWTLEYEAYTEFTPVGLGGNTWDAVSVGDDAGFDGPSSASADFSMLLRPQTGGIVLWQDGVSTGGFSVTDDSDADTDLAGDRYRVSIEFDEAADGLSALVTITYTMLEGADFDTPGAVTTLAPFAISFSDAERYIEFKAFNGSFLEGEQHEFVLDNLRISVAEPAASSAAVVPEPCGLALILAILLPLGTHRRLL